MRLEGNRRAAIHTEGFGIHIAHNRFECHPGVGLCAATTQGVVLGPLAQETTLVNNLYSGIDVADGSKTVSTYRFDNARPVLIQAPSGIQPLHVRQDDKPRLVIGADGNVAIGRESADEKLHVRGNVKLDGNLVSDGEICIGSGC